MIDISKRKRGVFMKEYSIIGLAIKILFLSVFGLSTMPFLEFVIRNIDEITYMNMHIIIENPLFPMQLILWLNIILSAVYFIYCFKKKVFSKF